MKPCWLDHGNDFYAARVFRDGDNGGKADKLIGWMGNWSYANETPKSWGHGALSIPRHIRLARKKDDLRILQSPLVALETLRGEKTSCAPGVLRGVASPPELQGLGSSYELDAEFHFIADSAAFGLELCAGGSQVLRLGYDPASSQVFLDRRQSGKTDFSPDFAVVNSAPVGARGGRLRLRVFIDHCSVEVFVNDGETVLTSLVFPDPKDSEIRLFGGAGGAKLANLDAWPLKSVWRPDNPPAPE